jgi:DNA gyrase subunit B
MTTTNELNQAQYDASHITVLEWLEPVRKRPGMYIWSTDIKWLHHTIQEIVDNAVDEALAGHCSAITTILHKDGTVTVHDNGRWIPVDIHQKSWKSALEMVFTVLHAGGKFEKSAYKISGWLHGVGASVVNALSDWLEVTVHKNGKKYFQRYERGVPQWQVQEIGETSINGTSVTWQPDGTIFETTEFLEVTEIARMKHGAYLTPGVTFTIINENTNYHQRFCYNGGIKTWLKRLVGEQQRIGSQHYINAEGKDCLLEVAFQFVNTSNDNTISFVNNVPTPDDGTHVLWFKSALLSVINEFAQQKGLVHKKIGEFQYSDVTDGLYAIVTVKIPEPQFQGQTKWRLGNSYVRTVVEKIMHEYLTTYFTDNEDEFKAIFEKIDLAARARLAAKLAKETVLRKNVLAGGVLPGKLADCAQKKAEGTEMYIVEWDSAWGSAKQGRNSDFQAILPLRGKILNTEQAVIQKILANNEVKSLITAIGAGIKDNYEHENLRYEKIIIMTDADVDGAHIRTLLLTFFFRYMRPLINNGNLYVACPPIYKINQGKKEMYVYPPIEDLTVFMEKNGFDPLKTDVQRYKGLGEMNPEQLWETTMDPTRRKLFKVTVGDAEEADRLFRILMGEDVPSRKHFIMTHAKNVRDLDV